MACKGGAIRGSVRDAASALSRGGLRCGRAGKPLPDTAFPMFRSDIELKGSHNGGTDRINSEGR
jgi:hypothetical protein